MSAQLKTEIFWLLLTVWLTMVAMLIVSWQSNWELVPGKDLEIQLHDTFIVISYSIIGMYVFAHIAMLLYTIRNLRENFQRMKLSLVMLVVYGYVAYVNYMLMGMFDSLETVFISILGVTLLLAAITMGMVVLRLKHASSR